MLEQVKEPMKIKIKKLRDDAVLPAYAHGPDADAGMDLRALENVTLQPNVPTLVRTGLSIELPPGFEAQIRPRSGLALKEGITVLNSPATIDPSYRGDVGVILYWNGFNPQVDTDDTFRFFKAVKEVKAGDRIAQMVVASYEPIVWDEAENLEESIRGDGGFGSTGIS